MGAVPPALELVESFLNSVDVESGADDFATVERYRHWLVSHGQAADGVDEAALQDARALRDALRDAARAHHDHDATARAPLDALSDRIRLRAVFGPDGVGLEAGEDGPRRVLGSVLAAIVLAARDGSWQRLKLCRESTCQWVFYDQSKNSSKLWCSMRVCGNRNKTRAYRSRQRADS